MNKEDYEQAIVLADTPGKATAINRKLRKFFIKQTRKRLTEITGETYDQLRRSYTVDINMENGFNGLVSVKIRNPNACHGFGDNRKLEQDYQFAKADLMEIK